MVVNEDLHEEFEKFKHKIYSYVDKASPLLKQWNYFKFGAEQASCVLKRCNY